MQHLALGVAANLGLAVLEMWVIRQDGLEATVVARYDRAPGTGGTLCVGFGVWGRCAIPHDAVRARRADRGERAGDARGGVRS